jgi:transposase
MPQRRKSMKQIRKIIELSLMDRAISIRTIAEATKVSRPVVKTYIEQLKAHPLTLSELHLKNDIELKEHLGMEKPGIQETEENGALLKWLGVHIDDLCRTGVTRRLLHERFLEEHANGLRYSQFCFILNRQFKSQEVSSLFEHKAGDKLYTDFTGKKAVWTDTQGQSHEEEVFLAVLGASSYFYSVPVPSQKQEDHAEAVQLAFRFIGGVPHAVVTDCLKSAVLSHEGHESTPNPLFQRLMDHYGTISLPARPRRPKDKPQVEVAVNLVYRQILARMDTRTFEDRSAFLVWWLEAVNRINDMPFQKLPGSRRSRFEAVDRPALSPLPDSSFPLTNVLNQCVAPTGVIYIPDDKTSYSVPYSLQGKKVEVLVAPGYVEVWHDHERMARHDRQNGAGKVLCPTHRSESHRWFADRNTGELVRELSLKGAHVASWSRTITDRASHEDQAWMILCGLRQLAHKHPERIDTVCRMAIKQDRFALKDLKRIIERDEDLLLAEDERLNLTLPLHENVRGSGYYGSQEVPA